MTRLSRLFLNAALVWALFLAGCGAPAPPPPPSISVPLAASRADRPVVTIKVVAQAFEPKNLTLQANVPVTISVENATNQDHNLTVKDPEGHRVLEIKVPVGQTVTTPFAPTTPGTYIFYCKYALHRPFGEEGTLEVR